MRACFKRVLELSRRYRPEKDLTAMRSGLSGVKKKEKRCHNNLMRLAPRLGTSWDSRGTKAARRSMVGTPSLSVFSCPSLVRGQIASQVSRVRDGDKRGKIKKERNCLGRGMVSFASIYAAQIGCNHDSDSGDSLLRFASELLEGCQLLGH